MMMRERERELEREREREVGQTTKVGQTTVRRMVFLCELSVN